MFQKVEANRKYLDPQTLAKIQGLELRARRVIEGYVSGAHRSPYHGFSVEFAEHREYVPGDDLRHVDWKVFGRTDKFYLKQYEEETNLICYLVLDISQSMDFTSNPESLTKLEYAKCIAAVLSYLVLRQQDSVGLVTLDNEIRSFIRQSGNPLHIKQILQVLEESTGEKKTDTGPIFHDLAERLTKRGLVMIFSDLFDNVPSMMTGLKHFRHRRHEVVVFHVLDPAEVEFPFRQTTLFKGLEEYPEIVTNPRLLRKAYLEEFGAFQRSVKGGCRLRQVEYVPMSTDLPLDVALSTFLASRSARVT